LTDLIVKESVCVRQRDRDRSGAAAGEGSHRQLTALTTSATTTAATTGIQAGKQTSNELGYLGFICRMEGSEKDEVGPSMRMIEGRSHLLNVTTCVIQIGANTRKKGKWKKGRKRDEKREERQRRV
jgi:hypothetical protein